MSREIVEAVRGLAAEKNISSEKLMEALEDALLSAYKKTPDAARYAKVEMDRDSGDFKVWELKIPPELEEQLLIEATPDQQPTVDPETGEMREPPEPEIDLEKLKEYEDQIETEDVTPHDFGRIAATNAISDVYAMGGKPIMALAILGMANAVPSWYAKEKASIERIGSEFSALVLEGLTTAAVRRR